MITKSEAPSDLHEKLVQLDKIAKDRDWCFSVGTTRLTPNAYECRIFPKRQDVKKPVIIVSGKTLYTAIVNCLKRIESSPSPTKE